MFRRLAATATALLILLSSGNLRTEAQPISEEQPTNLSAEAPAIDVSQLNEELRFRRQLGFTTDVDRVAQLMSERANYQDYAVALTDAERAEIDRRVQVQAQMRPLDAFVRGLPGYAGHWIDQPAGGVITVAFTAGNSHRDSDIAKVVPAGAAFRTVTVDHSLQDLNDAADAIWRDREALRKQGVEIGHIAVDPSTNQVVVGLRRGDLGAEQASLRAAYGSSIATVYSNPETTGCTGRNTCPGPPLRAGISGAPKGSFQCSMAFLVQVGSGTTVNMLTAGHCARTLGVAWVHGDNNSWPLGTVKETCYPSCQYSDAARIGAMTTAQKSDRVYRTSTGGYSRVLDWIGYLDDHPGDFVCLSARFGGDGFRCGTLQYKGRITYQDGTYFDNMRFADYAGQYGDSGGAVHGGYTSNGVLAYGVQSGCTNLVNNVCEGLNVYSSIARIMVELGVYVCNKNDQDNSCGL
jgi:hypothetical protein